MRRLPWSILVGAMVLASCMPASTPVPTNTAVPPVPTALPTAEPSATVAPKLAPAALAGPQSGTSMTWLDGEQLVYVPAGDFTMGTGVTSTPEKQVYLDGFWVYSTEVTNTMYAQCVTTGNCAPPAQEVGAAVYTNPQYKDYPVVGVTWDMANNYCGWVKADLPTEAQWEKAARGSEASVYPWGINPPSCSLLNFKGCLGHTSGVIDYPDGRSPYGVYDMAGNVFEWTKDFYDEHAYDSMPSRNPTGPGSGDSHVVRGSSYETESSLLLSGVRHPAATSYHNADLGFRCAVTSPTVLAPFCQLSSYIPTGAGPSGSTCELPQTGVLRNYCSARVGYATITIPSGATYRITKSGYRCTDAIVNGERLLTCTGPDNTSGKVTVCNAACGGAPAATGAPIVCDPGYGLDPSSLVCNYSPVSAQPEVGGCPVGYNLIQRGDQQICAVGLNQNGECPIGTYYDGQYGACVSPAAGADVPYGIDNPTLASQAYQGCAAGYNYDPNYQCCQANAGGAYPGCPVGFVFDAAQHTCVPQQVSVSSSGCVAVQLYVARCAQVTDVCDNITYEGTCLRNPLCTWNDKKGFCSVKKPTP